MCYFHVNAILSPITIATRMIDRTGKIGAGKKGKREEVFLTPPTHKHTLMHKDKKATISVLNPKKKCEPQRG